MMLSLELSKGRLNGLPASRISNVKLMPVYNHYDQLKKDLRFIPLSKALKKIAKFDEASQKELKELERFCFEHLLPENYEHLLI